MLASPKPPRPAGLPAHYRAPEPAAAAAAADGGTAADSDRILEMRQAIADLERVLEQKEEGSADFGS